MSGGAPSARGTPSTGVQSSRPEAPGLHVLPDELRDSIRPPAMRDSNSPGSQSVPASSASPADAMIQLSGVRKTFAQPVLKNINLSIPTGCLYGLMGPGASGKSVLLKSAALLVKPDAGSVSVAGQDLTVLDQTGLQAFRMSFGMLFQNNALFDFMTVAENIAFPLKRLFELEYDQVKEMVAERLERVGLSGFEARFPANLSGGQKKRIGLARATITGAPVQLYDEPAAGLDPVTSQKIFDLLRREQQEAGSTVLMVSTDLDRLLSVVDRVGMMYEGELIFDGTVDEAKSSRDPYVSQFVHGRPDGPL